LSEARIASATTVTILLLLVGLLIGGLWALKKVGDDIILTYNERGYGYPTGIIDAQLGCLTGFVFAFSLITFFLGMSRFEVFASTAAYAAVLVFFILPS
jgi:hypothetical protein